MGRQRKLKQFDRQTSQLMTQTMKNAKAHSIIAADDAIREAVTLAEAVGLEEARDMLAFTLVERAVRGDRLSRYPSIPTPKSLSLRPGTGHIRLKGGFTAHRDRRLKRPRG